LGLEFQKKVPDAHAFGLREAGEVAELFLEPFKMHRSTNIQFHSKAQPA
jgi:hypothetical protein